MSDKTAMIYASVDGHTLKICKKLQEVLQRHGQPVELIPIDAFNGDLEGYTRVIIGASIRYGVHHKKIVELVTTRKEVLEFKRTAFFSVNLVARKPIPMWSSFSGTLPGGPIWWKLLPGCWSIRNILFLTAP